MAKEFELKVVKWERNPAHCVYINDYRIVGGKPWGGGQTTASWSFSLEDLQRAFPELVITRKAEVSSESTEED